MERVELSSCRQNRMARSMAQIPMERPMTLITEYRRELLRWRAVDFREIAAI
jgi:hypothetical protein